MAWTTAEAIVANINIRLQGGVSNAQEAAKKILKNIFVVDELAVLKRHVLLKAGRGGSESGAVVDEQELATAADLAEACNWFKPLTGGSVQLVTNLFDCSKLGGKDGRTRSLNSPSRRVWCSGINLFDCSKLGGKDGRFNLPPDV